MPRFPYSKMFYIHIPKTGGSSIENFFLEKEKTFPNGDSWFNDEDVLHQEKYLIQYVYQNQKCSYQHHTYLEIIDKVPEIDQYRIFTIVRNPYDRVVSDFHHFTKCKHDDPDLLEKFEKFVEDFLYHEDSIPDKYDCHALPQYKFIEGCSEANHLTILKFEKLSEEFLEFYEEPLDVKINVSDRHSDYRYYYTVKIATMIEEYYEEDFKQFDYDNTLSSTL